jgi:excisionase family DNA binding protein
MSYMTPPEVAKLLRVRRETVLAWIHTGKLAAINTADTTKRPRFKVDPSDLDAFKQSLLVKPLVCRVRRPRPVDRGDTQYF